MIVSFLICGLESRPWMRMRDTLLSQIRNKHMVNCGYECEVLTCIDSGEESSGTKRQRLLTQASGKYIAFVDDDDSIHDDYCSLICKAAAESPDVVCFSMRITKQVELRRRITNRQETWRLGLWDDNRRSGMMAANHLCAWKKLIAEQVAWCPEIGYGDDQLWYGPLHAAKIAVNAVVIPQILYEYAFSQTTTANQTSQRTTASRYYFGSGLRCFNIDGEILIEDGSQSRDLIQCRNSRNEFIAVSVSKHKPFHTVVLK